MGDFVPSLFTLMLISSLLLTLMFVSVKSSIAASLNSIVASHSLNSLSHRTTPLSLSSPPSEIVMAVMSLFLTFDYKAMVTVMPLFLTFDLRWTLFQHEASWWFPPDCESPVRVELSFWDSDSKYLAQNWIKNSPFSSFWFRYMQILPSPSLLWVASTQHSSSW